MKTIKKKDVQKAIITMLWEQDAVSRNQILNRIDLFLMSDLKLEKKDIPWLNGEKNNYEGYVDFLTLLRITYAKVISDIYNLQKKIH